MCRVKCVQFIVSCFVLHVSCCVFRASWFGHRASDLQVICFRGSGGKAVPAAARAKPRAECRAESLAATRQCDPGFGFAFQILGLRFGVWGLGFGVWGLGFGFRVKCLGFRVYVGFRVEGSG